MRLKSQLSSYYSKSKKIYHSLKEGWIVDRSKRQLLELSNLSSSFFVIGIPGALHIMALSLKFIPDDIDLALILNGMDDWEENWARQNLKFNAFIKLDSDITVPHNKIMDMLFDNIHQPFGILDYDCFVFNSAIFKQMQSISPEFLLNALFYQKSPILGRTPQTFCLFFNTEIVRLIKKKYHVKSKITDFQKGLSRKVIRQLGTIGIDKDHYPEYHKKYFDTLRLMVCLAHSEGFTCRYLNEFQSGPYEGSDAFHVGGVAHPNTTYGWWGVRGSYFWRRALEMATDSELKQRYEERFGRKKSSEVFTDFPKYKEQTSKDYFDFVEKIVSDF